MRIELSFHLIAGAAVLGFATLSPAHAEGNPQRGGMVFGACAVCHSLEPNLNLTGPSLAGRWDKKVASVADFPRYSSALKAKDFVWDEVTLNAWIADPNTFVPGTYMTFRGIPDAQQRSDLIAFLKIALVPNGAKAAVAQKLISADEARGQAPEPLANAPPGERVTKIRHCRDTFFVSTADGKERPFWELNLRLKVDSSETGPKENPVLLPAGMQGDRASIVFSDVAEIRSSIEERCQKQ